jgi:outer membrane protein assembly factor BamD
MKRCVAILSAVAFLAAAGCSARKQPSSENYYVKATDEYTQHFYKPAIDDYQKLIDEYPFSPYAEEAELNIGLAYYKDHNYAEAVGAFNDFLRMHPTSKHLDIATYYLAMSHYDQIGRPDQDQTHTELALEEFQTIERRFPESDFASLAGEQIAICREVLARHEFLIGEFYYKRANLRASESRLAELEALYPDTPIAPEGLYDLGLTLEKQGKKYSAAQAFTALKQHFPNTPYVAMANDQLKKLKQPIDTEEDPFKLVLAESGYDPDQQQQQVAVHEDLASLAKSDPAPGADGLPILTPAKATAVDPTLSAKSAAADNPGPATLNKVRLSSSDPPLSVVFDLTGPVAYDEHIDKGDDSATTTIFLKQVTLASTMPTHITFDKSIFRDADIQSDNGGAKITINTAAVSRFAVIPLNQPSRLLVTFTPVAGNAQAGADLGEAAN